MNRALIVAAWLLGLAAIAWSCSSRQGTAHAVANYGMEAIECTLGEVGADWLIAGESA